MLRYAFQCMVVPMKMDGLGNPPSSLLDPLSKSAQHATPVTHGTRDFTDILMFRCAFPGHEPAHEKMPEKTSSTPSEACSMTNQRILRGRGSCPTGRTRLRALW